MVLRYVEAAHLGRGQTSSISAVAFSWHGLFLASAALDGNICIWSVSDCHLLYVFSTVIPILALTWDDSEENLLICGMKDGNIVCLVITQTDIQVKGFWAHTYPVECVKTHGNTLVSGAHEEVKIWKRHDTDWFQEAVLQPPPKTSFNRFLQVVVTSVHWVTSSSGETQLVVTYLNHGVHIFSAVNFESAGSVPIPGQIADASISGDGKLIAISNVISGFDIYSFENGATVCSFGHTVGDFRKVPVMFVHGGLALVGGNVGGDVHIWDVGSGRKLHSLVHKKTHEVLAVAGHYDQDSDTFMIATGVLHGASESCVVLWKTEDLGQNTLVTEGGGRHIGRFPGVLLSSIIILASAITAVGIFSEIVA